MHPFEKYEKIEKNRSKALKSMKKALTNSIFAHFRAHFHTSHAFLIAPFHPFSCIFDPAILPILPKTHPFY